MRCALRYRGHVLCALLTFGLVFWGPTSVALSAQPSELMVTVFGGTFEKSWRSSVIQPFEKKYSAQVSVVSGQSGENLAKLRAQKDNPQIDVPTFDEPFALIAANEGLLEPLDPQRIPNLKSLFDFAFPKSHLYASFFTDSQVLVYNTQHVKQPPVSWEDLWKPGYKGKVALPDISTVSGAYFVAIMGKAYGKGLYDIDAALAKIKTLRPNVVTFYTSHDQLVQLLIQGEVWLAPWVSDRAAAQMTSGAPIGSVVPKEGAIVETAAIGIAKGAKNKALAEKYVNATLDPAIQKGNAATLFVGPTNRDVKLTADVAKLVPYGESVKRLVAPNWDEFAKQRDQWADRWNREIK